MKFDMKVQFIKFQNIYHVPVVAHQARLVVCEPPCYVTACSLLKTCDMHLLDAKTSIGENMFKVYSTEE